MHRMRGHGYGPSQGDKFRALCGVEHLELVNYVDVKNPTVVEVTKTTFHFTARMAIRELIFLVPSVCILYVNRKGK